MTDSWMAGLPPSREVPRSGGFAFDFREVDVGHRATRIGFISMSISD